MENSNINQQLGAAQATMAGGQANTMQPQQIGMPGQTQQQAPPMTPLDLLLKNAKSIENEDTKEISLKTLKSSEKAKIMQVFTKCKDVADQYYKNTIEPKLKERLDAYLATEEYYKKRFPVLSETSKFCSRDILTTIDCLIPSYMEVFCGSDDPMDVQGVNIEDDERAAKIQQLVKYQLQRKNNYTSFVEFIMRDALILNYAVAKVSWKREEKRERYELLVSQDNADLLTSMYQEEQQGHIEVISSKPLKAAPDLAVVTFEKIVVTADYPVVAYMPPSELRYTPDSNTIQSVKFKAHRKIVTGDYLKRKEREGTYSNIDEAIENGKGDTKVTNFDTDKNKELETIGDRISDHDNASSEIELYEAYLDVDYNNDGIMESVIVHAIGNTPIRIAKNDLELAPFFICQSKPSPHTVFNEKEGLCDNLIQQQDLKTAIFRQLIVNLAKNNTPRTFLNPKGVDMDALVDGDEFVLVDTENVSNAVYTPPQLPFNNLAMTVVQYAQNEIESQSGSTKYNQGLDSNSLNKTATGITAIMGASEKRHKNTARGMVDSFFVPMMKYLILLNQKYLDGETIVRLTNEQVTIKKEDLDIDYDLIINIGQGAGTKEAQIQYLMLLINQIYPQLASTGIVNANSWYEIVKDLLEKMGIRNVCNYLVDPNSEQAKQMQQQAQQAQQQAKQEQVQLIQAKLQADVEKAKQPHMSVNYRDLPVDAKQKALAANGIPSSANAIAAKEIMNHA